VNQLDALAVNTGSLTVDEYIKSSDQEHIQSLFAGRSEDQV